MDKMGYPKGLIRYTTENALEGKKSHILRPRLLGYFAALIIMVVAFAWAVNDRIRLSFDAERERHSCIKSPEKGKSAMFTALQCVTLITSHTLTKSVC